MHHLESKNITQLYCFLAMDCKIKVSLSAQKRSQSEGEVRGIYPGVWWHGSVLLRSLFKKAPVSSCGTIRIHHSFMMRSHSPHHSSPPQSTAGILEPGYPCPTGNSVYRQSLLFGSASAQLRLSQTALHPEALLSPSFLISLSHLTEIVLRTAMFFV